MRAYVGWEQTRRWTGPHETVVAEYVRLNGELPVGTTIGLALTLEAGLYPVVGEQPLFTVDADGTVIIASACAGGDQVVVPADLSGMNIASLQSRLKGCENDSEAALAGDRLKAERLRRISSNSHVAHFGAECTVAYSGTPLRDGVPNSE